MKKRGKLSNIVRENLGITLIALVITIIVLLILVGVTLTFVTGSDGILEKAELARVQHEMSTEKESLEISYSEVFMNYELFDEEITADDLAKQIEENGKNAGVVEDEDDPNTLIVTFDKTNNIYYINMTSGKVEFIGTYDGADNDIELQAGDIEFKTEPSDWTNESVLTTMSVNDEIDMTNFVLQYSKDGKKWSVYASEIESTKNETIYARIKHSMTGQKKLEASTSIANIDKLEPTGTLEVTAQTTNSITVKVTANDQAKTADNACSGIKGYYYSSDNGTTWTEITTDATYTFENLAQTTDYNLKVKIEDNAGNITETTATGATGTVSAASSSNVTYTTSWSGTNATVTFTTETGYTIETSTDNTTWSEANPITVATGTQIYVRLSDGTNGGMSYSAVKPVLTYTVAYNGNGATSGSTASSSHEYGTAKALTANGFSKTGYTFLGWSTSSTATSATYTDGQSVTNLSSTNGATVTLYAVWSKLVDGISLDKTSIDDFVTSNNSTVNKLTDTITATITNSNAANKEIEWSSSDSNIATVDQNGKVTAVAAGNCTITAKAKDASGKSASCTITVKERKYVYYYGNQFSDITGGWKASSTPSPGSTYYSSLYSSGTNYIYIGNRSGGYWYYCNGITVNEINTEDYDSLVMETKIYLSAASWQGNAIWYGMAGVITQGTGADGINEQKTTTFDISDKHNTSGYIYIQNSCGHTALPYTGYDPNSYIYLYQAYFEK